jgi:tetratricopeptide (TPR) repeat protein
LAVIGLAFVLPRSFQHSQYLRKLNPESFAYASKLSSNDLDRLIASDSFVRRVEFYRKHGRKKEKWLKLLDYGLKNYPKNANAYYLKIRILIEDGELEAARAELNKALQVRPDDARFNEIEEVLSHQP